MRAERALAFVVLCCCPGISTEISAADAHFSFNRCFGWFMFTVRGIMVSRTDMDLERDKRRRVD